MARRYKSRINTKPSSRLFKGYYDPQAGPETVIDDKNTNKLSRFLTRRLTTKRLPRKQSMRRRNTTKAPFSRRFRPRRIKNSRTVVCLQTSPYMSVVVEEGREYLTSGTGGDGPRMVGDPYRKTPTSTSQIESQRLYLLEEQFASLSCSISPDPDSQRLRDTRT